MLRYINPSLLALLACTSICVCMAQLQQTLGEEEAIIKKLFLDDPTTAEANRIVRPPGNDEPSGPVKVEFGFTPVAIASFDELTGYLSVHVWERTSWVDTRLKWNSSTGLQNIRVPAKYLWIPDLVLYSSGSKEGNFDVHEEKAVISPDGLVWFIPKRNYNFHCSLDMTYFPYDNQTCALTVGSWLHSTSDLEVFPLSADLSNFYRHSDWYVQNLSLNSLSMYYPCCPEAYQTITMTLEMMREPDFYFSIFVAPAIVIFFLLPIIHLFPPGCSQKTTLAGLLLLCILVLQGMIYQQIGGYPEENSPMLLKHCHNLMTMIIISIGISSYTSTLANAVHTSRRVPAIIRKVMNTVVGRICCFRSADVRGTFTQLGQTSSTIKYDPQNDMAPIVNDATDDDNNQGDLNNSALHQLVNEMRYVRERGQLQMEWYQVALLLDRLTVVVFTLNIIIDIATIHA